MLVDNNAINAIRKVRGQAHFEEKHSVPSQYIHSMTSKKPIRTNPELWEACKKEAVEKAGKFSARAMQRAVVLYKERGEGYIGIKSEQNPLVKWNEAQKKPPME